MEKKDSKNNKLLAKIVFVTMTVNFIYNWKVENLAIPDSNPAKSGQIKVALDW